MQTWLKSSILNLENKHILKFKIRTNFMVKYKTPKYDLHEEVKRLRKVTSDWD